MNKFFFYDNNKQKKNSKTLKVVLLDIMVGMLHIAIMWYKIQFTTELEPPMIIRTSEGKQIF